MAGEEPAKVSSEPFFGAWFTGGADLCVSFVGDLTGVPSLLEGGFETGELLGSGNGDGFPVTFRSTVGEL